VECCNIYLISSLDAGGLIAGFVGIFYTVHGFRVEKFNVCFVLICFVAMGTASLTSASNLRF
jgi:hypothetical protein